MASITFSRNDVLIDLEKKRITSDEAIVLLVIADRVRIVRGKLTPKVRSVLNAAVKAGRLGHIKAVGAKREAYHSLDARDKAMEQINREYRASMDIMSKVCEPGI